MGLGGQLNRNPPPPSLPGTGAPSGSAALNGGGQGRAPPHVRRFFCNIPRADGVTGAATARLLPNPRRAGEGEGGGTGSAMEGAPASVSFSPPSPPLPLREAAEVQRVHGAGADAPAPDSDAPRAPIGDDP